MSERPFKVLGIQQIAVGGTQQIPIARTVDRYTRAGAYGNLYE